MASKLLELLSLPPRRRTPEAYEAMYDDFITFAGGQRVSLKCQIPKGKQNADYWLEFEQAEMLLELKQLTKYAASDSVNSYFEKLLLKGKVKSFKKTPDGKVIISPESLSSASWDRFYRKFRPAVESGLRIAANQLRDTDDFMPRCEKRRIKGVVFLNSGDFNLPTDLLFRQVERKAKHEWKLGRFTSIDFVSCITVDLFRHGKHPLHSRHIVRSTADQGLVSTVEWVTCHWLSYACEAFGLTLQAISSGETADMELELQQPFEGKIAMLPNAGAQKI